MRVYKRTYKNILRELYALARKESRCVKAQVGARIVSPLQLKTISDGFNITMPDSCKSVGCHRVAVYGENSCEHRLPSDCYALHAEICAISMAAMKSNKSTINKTMVVTRYPCEACARAIVAAGIMRVVYGGVEEISEQTRQIFSKNDVDVQFIHDDEIYRMDDSEEDEYVDVTEDEEDVNNGVESRETDNINEVDDRSGDT